MIDRPPPHFARRVPELKPPSLSSKGVVSQRNRITSAALINLLAVKGIAILACVLFTVVAPPPGFAQASGVDWKLYGGASVEGDSVCFYEAKGVVRGPEDHMRVWIKCLLRKDMDNFAGKIDVEKIGRKLIAGYVPPIVVVGAMNFDQITDIAIIEAYANTGQVKPAAQILYELNCSERMLRELSFSTKGKSVSRRPLDWKYSRQKGTPRRY